VAEGAKVNSNTLHGHVQELRRALLLALLRRRGTSANVTVAIDALSKRSAQAAFAELTKGNIAPELRVQDGQSGHNQAARTGPRTPELAVPNSRAELGSRKIESQSDKSNIQGAATTNTHWLARRLSKVWHAVSTIWHREKR
jgi:hypothetical protein